MRIARTRTNDAGVSYFCRHRGRLLAERVLYDSTTRDESRVYRAQVQAHGGRARRTGGF